MDYDFQVGQKYEVTFAGKVRGVFEVKHEEGEYFLQRLQVGGWSEWRGTYTSWSGHFDSLEALNWSISSSTTMLLVEDEPVTEYKIMSKDEYAEFTAKTFKGLQSLMKGKNDDYAEGSDFFANFRQAEEYGVDPLKGLFVRMGDKQSRIKAWCRRGDLKVKGEGLVDSLLDNIGYSMLALAYIEECHRNGVDVDQRVVGHVLGFKDED
jgi:hypothetical protein